MANMILHKFKGVKISLFGAIFTLSESYTEDFINLLQYTIENGQTDSKVKRKYESIVNIHNSLKWYVNNIPSWRFIKKYNAKRKSSINYLYFNLTTAKLNECLLKIESLYNNKEKIKRGVGSFLGADQSYMLIMSKYKIDTDEIGRLPVSSYLMMISEAINQSSLHVLGGKYRFSSKEDDMLYKKMLAYNEIQELKRAGKWE